MSTKNQDHEDEVKRLRARVAQLEQELKAEKQTAKDSSDTGAEEKGRRIANRGIKVGSSLIRAIALAGIEEIRLGASVLSSFADTVSDRNRREMKQSSNELLTDLPADIYSGLVNAIDQSLEMPGKAFDKLQQSYKESMEN